MASVTALAAFSPVFAEDEEATEENKSAENSSAEGAEGEVAAPAAQPEKPFYPLLRCVRAEGTVRILRPRTQDWVAAEEGRFYPLGSTIQVTAEAGKPLAQFEFGEKAQLVIKDAAEVVTRAIEIGEKTRTVELKGGRIAFELPRTLKEGVFRLVLPSFTCENLAGNSTFAFTANGDGDEVVVRCVTGQLAVKGAHYEIPKMGAANQVSIRTTTDQLFTSLRGQSGDCKVILDRGLVQERNFETGEMKDVAKPLEFSLSPQCAVKIFRAKAAVGGRVSVSMMTFSPSGEMLNRFAFAEGRSNVNSGELVIAPVVPAEKDAKDKANASDDDEAEEVEAAPKSAQKKAAAKDDEEEDDKEEAKADDKDEEKEEAKDDEESDKKDAKAGKKSKKADDDDDI